VGLGAQRLAPGRLAGACDRTVVCRDGRNDDTLPCGG
jgi:hypothetical protein